MELVMGVGPMNLVITNDALYQLSYTSELRRRGTYSIIPNPAAECKVFFALFFVLFGLLPTMPDMLAGAVPNHAAARHKKYNVLPRLRQSCGPEPKSREQLPLRFVHGCFDYGKRHLLRLIQHHAQQKVVVLLPTERRCNNKPVNPHSVMLQAGVHPPGSNGLTRIRAYEQMCRNRIHRIEFLLG